MRHDNARGAALVSLAVLFWGLNDTVVKLVAAEIGVPAIIFLRGIATVVLMVGVALATGWRPTRASLLHPLVLLRGLIEAATVLAYLHGVAHLPIALASTLMFTSPIFGVILGRLVLREHVSKARVQAVALGFLGMVAVTDPFGSPWSPWLALPFAAALLQALGDLVTHRIDPAIPSDSITIVTLAMVMLGGAAMGGVGQGLPDGGRLGLLLVAAVLMTIAYVCYIRAFRVGEMSFVAPFKYLSIPVMMLVGWLVWSDRPSPTMLGGALLIVMAGAWIVWQDRRDPT